MTHFCADGLYTVLVHENSPRPHHAGNLHMLAVASVLAGCAKLRNRGGTAGHALYACARVN